ncbi:hypothetical protein MMC26_000131 [Xylographa opegraphella]|nr:hypothetical protein [Xylographa opegraphella]
MLLSGNSSLAALTTASSASTTPSVSSSLGERYLGKARVLEHDHEGALHPAPLRHQVVFECPFNFLYCLMTFTCLSDSFNHSLTHFKKNAPPEKNKCCFCDVEFARSDGMRSWRDKMEHTALHHKLGHKLAHARPDFAFYTFLWNKHIIEAAEYKDLMGGSHGRSGASSYPSPPSSPDRVSASNTTAVTVTNSSRGPRERRERRG